MCIYIYISPADARIVSLTRDLTKVEILVLEMVRRSRQYSLTIRNVPPISHGEKRSIMNHELHLHGC